MKLSRTTLILLLFVALQQAVPQASKEKTELDRKVEQFLASHEDSWHDMNVPAEDGKFLYDLIVSKKFKRALEIGTSTGHSSIWIGWALSKTGGKLITIEIDPSRHKTAVENIRQAGLSQFVDARLADAHELVPELKGPFDFVFCDADKDWYKNYFIAVSPQLSIGGCFTAHNVPARGHAYGGIHEFVEYVKERPNYTTEIHSSSGAGISVSCKTAVD